MPDPLISVVTPSFNQAPFLRQAIDSVLGQGYPRVEYLVIDGGSTDGTLDVLRSYGDRFFWVSERDRGQSDAINRGFRRARGEILAWLNSDDVYAEGALERAAAAFREHPEAGLVYGRGGILDARGSLIGEFEGIEPPYLWRLLHYLDYVLQPAAFFRRSALERAGLLDESLHFAMDWDLWIRLAAEADLQFVDQVLAYSREYGETKTATGGWKRIREQGNLMRRHAGRFWTPGVKCYALDTLGRKVKRLAPTFLHRAADRAVALLGRSINTRLAAYPDGWLGPDGRIVVPRRWGGVRLELEVHRLPARGRLELRLSAADDGQVEVLSFDRPGTFGHTLALPPSDDESGLVEIRLASGFSFSTPTDPRRLAVRCRRLEPWSEPVATST